MGYSSLCLMGSINGGDILKDGFMFNLIEDLLLTQLRGLLS